MNCASILKGKCIQSIALPQACMYGARFYHGFCCVRVSIVGLRLLYGARFQKEIPIRGLPLDPTHVRLKLLHACDQWHSSRVFTTSCMRVTNSIPLGCPLLLPVGTVNSVQSPKAGMGNALDYHGNEPFGPTYSYAPEGDPQFFSAAAGQSMHAYGHGSLGMDLGMNPGANLGNGTGGSDVPWPQYIRECGARFRTGFCTRGCHWIPHLFA
jgi:hypothetical protein